MIQLSVAQYPALALITTFLPLMIVRVVGMLVIASTRRSVESRKFRS